MTPALSVVIVSFRSREPLAACLDSLARCRERCDLEAIVVDNASADGTLEWVAEAHPWVRALGSPANDGFPCGVNRGMAEARARHALVLNPDCEVSAEGLERLLDAARRDARLAAAAPMLVQGDGRPARSCGRFPGLWALLCDHFGLARRLPDSPVFGRYKYGGRAVESLDRVDWASGAALLVPLAVWREVGGFDERIFLYMEEVDWCRRAAHAGYHVRLVPQARIVHHGQRSARQVPRESYLHNLRSRVYYFRKHHGALAALAARVILGASLAAKWCATWPRTATRTWARVYAAGLHEVAAAGWR